MRVRHSAGLVTFDVEDSSPIVRSILVREAAEDLAQYPQYAGYHDDESVWYVVRFTRRVVMRGARVAFEVGDLALCRDRDEAEAETGLTLPTAYSHRNRVHTAVRPTDFVRV